MLISELEAQLKELREQHGDLPVCYSNLCGDYGVTYPEVHIVDYHKDKYEKETIRLNDYY